MSSSDLHAKLMEIVLEITEMIKEKNSQYGDNNLPKYGLLGVILRLHDKLARLEGHIFTTFKTDDEVVEETLKDIAGYAINALRLYKENRLSPFGELEKYIEGVKR